MQGADFLNKLLPELFYTEIELKALIPTFAEKGYRDLDRFQAQTKPKQSPKQLCKRRIRPDCGSATR